jgi:hypothetical protein
MLYPQDQHDLLSVVNVVDDAVVADPDPKGIVTFSLDTVRTLWWAQRLVELL